MKSKKNGEFAHVFIQGLLEECTKREDERGDLDIKLENAVRSIIMSSTLEILGGDSE